MSIKDKLKSGENVYGTWCVIPSPEVINIISKSELINALRDPKNYESEVEVNDVLESKNLTHSEKSFIELRMEGMTMEEISVDLGESAYKVRAGLREKFTEIGTDEEIT